jgi:hypothetical protein
VGRWIARLFEFFSNGGAGVGAKVADGAVLATLLAALSPAVVALIQHKDEVAITLTWGQLAFGSAFLGALGFFVLKIVQYTPPPPPRP